LTDDELKNHLSTVVTKIKIGDIHYQHPKERRKNDPRFLDGKPGKLDLLFADNGSRSPLRDLSPRRVVKDNSPRQNLESLFAGGGDDSSLNRESSSKGKKNVDDDIKETRETSKGKIDKDRKRRKTRDNSKSNLTSQSGVDLSSLLDSVADLQLDEYNLEPEESSKNTSRLKTQPKRTLSKTTDDEEGQLPENNDESQKSLHNRKQLLTERISESFSLMVSNNLEVDEKDDDFMLLSSRVSQIMTHLDGFS